MMELSFAKDAEINFLEGRSRYLRLDPLKPGQKALAITSQDLEGISLIGTEAELRAFSRRLSRMLQLDETPSERQIKSDRHFKISMTTLGSGLFAQIVIGIGVIAGWWG